MINSHQFPVWPVMPYTSLSLRPRSHHAHSQRRSPTISDSLPFSHLPYQRFAEHSNQCCCTIFKVNILTIIVSSNRLVSRMPPKRRFDPSSSERLVSYRRPQELNKRRRRAKGIRIEPVRPDQSFLSHSSEMNEQMDLHDNDRALHRPFMKKPKKECVGRNDGKIGAADSA